jgi:hypothetical protein
MKPIAARGVPQFINPTGHQEMSVGVHKVIRKREWDA